MNTASKPKRNGSAQIPPLLTVNGRNKERAPTLYAVIGYKLVKGVVLLMFAVAVFSLRNGNLQEEFSRVLTELSPSAQRGAFEAAADSVRSISPMMIQLIAVGSLLYGAFSIVEGAGLFLRAAWAGWMAIAESALFIPVGCWEVAQHFSFFVSVVLVLNVGIVWYLYRKRRRLFHLK
ncbi:MAG: DUF2127 domain-containing protein [Limisphaerales bacterium]